MMVDTPEHEIIAILEEYGPLVRCIAKSACYSSVVIDIADLRQVGEFAVLKAIKSYDPCGGTTIKSYVSRVVRNEIYREAARFLGVFTVDHRVTSLAAKINKLHASGKSDEEIVDIINTNNNRNIDVEHIRDLRIAYSRRRQDPVAEDDAFYSPPAEENTIRELLQGVVYTKEEEFVLQERIMGDTSAKDVAHQLNVTLCHIYNLERAIKERIGKAIEGIIE